MQNRCRQESLLSEEKTDVKFWSKRVNFGSFRVCIVDSFSLYENEKRADFCMYLSNFFELLSEKLFNNIINAVLRKRRTGYWNTFMEGATRVPVSGMGNHRKLTKLHHNEMGS